MQTITIKEALYRLRERSAAALAEHVEVEALGGYVSPFEGYHTVEVTDPIVITKEKHARDLALAADLLELHNDTGINITEWPSAREFVLDSMRGEGFTTPIVGDH